MKPSLSVAHPFPNYAQRSNVLTPAHAQWHLTLCNPMDGSSPSSSVHGIFQARILEWVAVSSSKEIFPTQGLNLHVLLWQADSLPLRHLGSLMWHLHMSKWTLVLVACILLDLIAATWILILKAPSPPSSLFMILNVARIFFFQKADSSDSTWGLLASTLSGLYVCFHLSI